LEIQHVARRVYEEFHPSFSDFFSEAECRLPGYASAGAKNGNGKNSQILSRAAASRLVPELSNEERIVGCFWQSFSETAERFEQQRSPVMIGISVFTDKQRLVEVRKGKCGSFYEITRFVRDVAETVWSARSYYV
jgi:hypothetical protein